MMRVFCNLLGALVLTGCATFGPPMSQRFFVRQNWVRNTLESEYLGVARQHRFSPIVYENLVISANGVDGIIAFDKNKGTEIWRTSIKNGSESGGWIHQGHLFVATSDGFFYSLDAKMGQVKWSYPVRAEGLGAPTVDGEAVYFLAGNNIVHALDLQTGRMLWVYSRRDPSAISIRGGAKPTISGDQLIVGFSDGTLVAIKKQSGSILWETVIGQNQKFKDVDGGAVIDGDQIFVTSFDGQLVSLEKSNGKLKWAVPDGGESAVTLYGNTLFQSTSKGSTRALDKSSGKVLWETQNPTGIGSQPVVYKEFLLVGQLKGPLLFLDPRTGKKISEYSTGWGITSAPVVDSVTNKFYFNSAGANLYSLEAGWQRGTSQLDWEKH